MTNCRWSLLAPAIMTVALLAVYLRTAGFDLINIDDYDYLVSAWEINSGLSVSGLRWAWTSVNRGIWMPLTWFSYMLDFSLFGSECWGAQHLHNVALHVLNAVLVFVLIRELLKSDSRTRQVGPAAFAFVTAAFWAFHPLRVESVAWLSSRKDVLSFAFELGAFLFWITAVRRKLVDGVFCTMYLASILCFSLGAMAKPSVMTYPILQACVDLFLLRRLKPKMYILPCAMLVGIALEAAVTQSIGGATDTLSSIPFLARLANATSAFGVYLTNTVCPTDLAPQCMNRYPALPRNLSIGITLSIATALFLVFRIRKLWIHRQEAFARENETGLLLYRGEVDWVFVGIAWFCVGIGPMLGIANFGYHAFADRFTYIPAVGLSIVLVRPLLMSARLLLCLFPALAALAILSAKQVCIWRSDATVARQTLKVDGEQNVFAHLNLGKAAFEIEHDIEVACREFSLVKKINEGAYWECVQLHIYALCEGGRTREAEDALFWYGRAVARWNAAHRQSVETGLGEIEVPHRLTNYDDAKMAVALCDEEMRETAYRSICERVFQSGLTPSLAYLMHRYAVVTADAAKRKKAVELLQSVKKKDFLQFRYLTKKEA